MSPDLRERMGRAACDLARNAGYVNAGTVEFILDSRKGFYFLEMNTRLQVEHPVTEMVTGLDLVELQLQIASGERLPFDQAGIQFTGCAMVARICAEDPARSFMPATGMITRYAEPKGKDIRVDSGVRTGSNITVYYDSLLSKVICRGADREEARTCLIQALNRYDIEGVTSNIDFVNSVLSHPAFAEGEISTGFIDRHFEADRAKIAPDTECLRLAALSATLVYHVRKVAVRESLQPMVSRIGRTKEVMDRHRYIVRSENDMWTVELEGTAASRLWHIQVDTRCYAVETPEFEFYRRRLKLKIDGRTHYFRIRSEKSFVFAAFSGIRRLFECYTPKEWELISYMPARVEQPPDNVLLCPMPGLVVDVFAKKGDTVYRGQNLVILESMKMESGVASPCDGSVADVRVRPGQAVEAGDVLVMFEA